VRNFLMLSLLTTILLSSGCASMVRLHVKIKLDKKQIMAMGAIPTIEVNLVGINEAEYPQWEKYSLDQYWSAKDNLRLGGDRKTFKFEETAKIEQELRADGAIWDIWAEKSARYLFIMADIPGMTDKQPGGQDGRLLILPLNPDNWRHDTITVTVKIGGVTCIPSPTYKK
jgi:hypothetical protein